MKNIFVNVYKEHDEEEPENMDENDGDGKVKGDPFTEIPRIFLSPQVEALLRTPEVKDTLSFFKDKTDSTCSYFRCELCYRIYKNKETRKLIEFRKFSDIMKPQGYRLPANAGKLKARLNHHYTKVHLEAKAISPQTTPEVSREEVTEKLIALVYLETKLGIPFQAHEGLTRGLDFLKFDVGSKLHSRKSAAMIVKHLSDTLHTDLIHYLATNRPPFSMMLDSRY